MWDRTKSLRGSYRMEGASMCCGSVVLQPPRRDMCPSPRHPGAVPSSASQPLSPQLGREPQRCSRRREPEPRACPLGGAADPNRAGENARNLGLPKGLRLGGQPRTPSRLHLSCFQGFPNLSFLSHFLLQATSLLASHFFHPL